MFFQINTDKKQIRTFGFGLATILCILPTIHLLLKDEGTGYTTPLIFYSIAGLVFILSTFIPITLKPIYIPIMFFAHCLGWINTRLLLGVLFYFLFTPISLFFKIIRRDILDRKFEPDKKTYWFSKTQEEQTSVESMEKQF